MADFQSQDYITALGIDPDAAVGPRLTNSRWRSSSMSRRCIGCKACQAACMEWNNLRQDIGYFEAPTTIPMDLSPDVLDADALHRMGGREGQPRVADPQGRLHALRGPGLPEGLPGAGRDRAICQRHRRFHQRELHRLRLLRQRLPVRHPRISLGRPQVLQVHTCARTVSRVGLEPACVKACPTGAIMFGSKADMTAWAGERIEDLKSRGFAECRPV